MAEKYILSVEFDFPGGLAEYVDSSSRQCLSDADLVVFNPSMTDIHGEFIEMYKGKPSLSQGSSARLSESIAHWRREISDALSAGKTVVVFLCEKDEVYVDSGRRQYSGTGRNRATTIVVSDANNYQSLPGDLSFVNAKGSALRLAQNADLLAAYWNQFEDRTEYVVHIQGQVTQRLLQTRDGSKTLGAVVRVKGSPGTMVLLPPIKWDWDEFYVEKDDEIHWTKRACQFGHTLRNALLEIDKTLRASSMRTPAPEWTRDARYRLSRESELMNRVLQIEEKIEALEEEKATLKGDVAAESALRKLLYEKGKPLEAQIRRSLEILGFTVSSYRDSESEFDVVFESAQGRLLGEAEGKDNKAVNVDKLRQLEMNIHEDFSRDSVETMAKGVLFGNAHRLKPLEQRPDWFTQKCITAAARSGTALVRTSDLFFIARYLAEKNDASFAARCREAIFAANRTIVEFPKAPEGSAAERRANVPRKRKTQQTTRESNATS
jgi:hypothetical protein